MANFSRNAEKHKVKIGRKRPPMGRGGSFHLHYIFELIMRKITKKNKIY